MSRIIFTLVCFTSLINSCFGQDKLKQLDVLMSQYYEYGQFNGSVLVAEEGKVIYRKGFGMANMEWDIPNEPNTKHRLGSITKQFTALLILQLAADNKLDLHAPITTYLTDYPKANGDQITTHHLLSHSSGIPNYTSFPGFFAELSRDPYTPEEFTKEFDNKALEFTPGEKFSYSNSGYFLLGLLIEKLTGKSYEQVLDEKIFIPLGMKDSGYDNHSEIIKNRATGYEKDGRAFINSHYLDMSIPYAAGSLYSTVEDLYLWDQALYTTKLLPQKYMDLFFKPVFPASMKSNYAYGWSVGKVAIGNTTDSLAVISHGGGINGFNTNISRAVSDKSLIVLLNNTGGAPLAKITRAIRGVLYNKPYDVPKQSVAYELLEIIKTDGLPAGLQFFNNNKGSETMELDEGEMNQIGYELLGDQKTEAAAQVFKLNVDAFPESSNVYDSYAEALMNLGDNAGAIKNYTTSIEMNPANQHGLDMLKKLGVDTKELEKEVVIPETLLASYIGEYELAPSFIITVTKEGKQLKAQATGQGMFDIFPKSNNEFYYKVVDAQLVFNKDETGTVESLTLLQNGNKTTGKKLNIATSKSNDEHIVSEKVLESYVGSYEIAPDFILTVTKEGKQLKTQATGQNKFDIFPKSDSVFYPKAFKAQITFNKNNQGTVESITLKQNGRETTGMKIKAPETASEENHIVPNKILESYEGKYALSPTFIITITKDGQQMNAQATGQNMLSIYPKTNKLFYFKAVDAQITFNSNDDGEIESLTLLQNGQEQIAKKMGK